MFVRTTTADDRHVLSPQWTASLLLSLAASAEHPDTEEVAMPLMDKIEKYTVSVSHNDIVDYDRSIRLSLESGGTAQILFPATRPQDPAFLENLVLNVLTPMGYGGAPGSAGHSADWGPSQRA